MVAAEINSLFLRTVNYLPVQKLVLFLFFCCSWVDVFAQWTDDFSDGEFLSNPAWIGDTADFMVNSSGQLQLQATDPSTSRLSAAVPLADLSNVEWRFTLQLAFSPSSSNYARVYLVSDRDDFSGNGYFLQFGEALSNDAVELFRQDGSNYVSVCRGTNGQIASAFSLGVKVTRDDVGVWRIFLDTAGVAVYHQVALGAEGMYSQSGWTGISCTYTSANTTRFYVDDFYVGPLVVDTTPLPAVLPHAVIFSEVYFEPDVDALLPPVEFVELYNRTEDTVSLAGWSISDGATTARFPIRCQLPPKTYGIVSAKDDTVLFAGRGFIIGLTGFPALNNDVGDQLVLSDVAGVLIDRVVFSDRTYRDASKDDGGWTVERIDTSFLCYNEENWLASTNATGGTPGRVNAVSGLFRDTLLPWIQNAWLEDSTTIRLRFSEEVNAVEIINPDNYRIQPTSGNTVGIVQLNLSDAVTVELQLSAAVNLARVVVKNAITDCSGNHLDTVPVVDVGFPVLPLPGDVVVNELLFDAADGTTDFVELLNRSSFIIDLKDLQVAETDFENEIISGTPKVLTRDHRLLFPGELFLFTENERALQQTYPVNCHQCMQRLSELPDFNSADGGVLLVGADGSVLDRMKYAAAWHYPLLTDTKGVSLERTSRSGDSGDRSTWHSAAGEVGYATPGKENSQHYESGDLKGEVSVNPVVFSPDNDGNEDVMMLSFHFPDPGRMIACRIFSASGRLVRFLVNNELAGNEGVFAWDGTDDNHRLVASGRYVVFMETFSLDGRVQRYRLGCGVVYR